MNLLDGYCVYSSWKKPVAARRPQRADQFTAWKIGKMPDWPRVAGEKHGRSKRNEEETDGFVRWNTGLRPQFQRSVEAGGLKERIQEALGRAAVGLRAEKCDDLVARLLQKRPPRLPEDCHLSRQLRSLFNLLVCRKGTAPFLAIARKLWRREYRDQGWANLDPRSPEYRKLCDRIRKAQKDLGKHLLDGKARYETHFSAREGVVILEKL